MAGSPAARWSARLQRLFADIAQHRVDTVVVYKVDRLTRSLMDFGKMVELFDRHGVTFVARAELTGRGKEIGGECSCPVFEDWGFCKHMVATALAANAAGSDAQVVGASALARIRDHLKEK